MKKYRALIFLLLLLMFFGCAIYIIVLEQVQSPLVKTDVNIFLLFGLVFSLWASAFCMTLRVIYEEIKDIISRMGHLQKIGE